MRHWGKALVGLIVTALALWWAFRDVELDEVWAHLREGNVPLLLAAVAVATFGFLIRAMRWRILLAPVRADTTLHARFAAVSIGFMANNVLPARVGEFARAFALSRMTPVSASAAFGSLVVERFMDGVVLLLFLVIPALTPWFPETGVFADGFGALVLRLGIAAVLAVMMVLFAMAAWPRGFIRVAERVARHLPRSLARPVVDALEAFLDSLALLRDPRLVTAGFLWTLAFWTWHGLSFYLGMLAFGIDAGIVAAYFTEAVVGFGVAPPSAPGFVGTFHAASEFALSDVYGVESARSLAFAVGYHFGGWVPITAIGLVYAWKVGMSLGDVSAAEQRVEQVIEEEPPGAEAIPGGDG